MKFTTILALCLFFTLVIADDRVEHEERTMQIQVQPNQVQIQSETPSNKFQVHIDVNDPRLEIGLDMNTQSAEYNFHLKLNSIVEYAEAGNVSSGFDPVSDKVGNVWTFHHDTFVFSQLPDTVSGNATIKNFQGKSNDGVFVIIGHVAGGPFSYGALGTITPVSFKFDLFIDGDAFGYTLNNSRLALVTSIQSESSTSTRTFDDQDKDVTSTGGAKARSVMIGAPSNPIGFFSWANSVSINSTTTLANVITSPMVVDTSDKEGDSEGESNKRVTYAFDYVQPHLVAWDPVIGAGAGSLTNDETQQSSPSLFLIVFMLLSVVVV